MRQCAKRPGLRPNENLLFNGWGITPAGEHVTVSDMPLKLIVSPDGKFLLAVSGGYNNTGLTILNTAEKRVVQFVPLKQSWNGLAFSKDGKRLLVSGGGSGLIHVFKYENGTATAEKPVRPVPGSKNAFVAAIVVHPVTGKVYVCNEGRARDLGAERADAGAGNPDRCRPASAFVRARGGQSAICM